MRSTCVGWKAFLLSVPNVLPIRSVCDNHWTPRRAITRSVHISTDGQIRPRNWYRNILLKNQLVLFIDYDLAQISDDILHVFTASKRGIGFGERQLCERNAAKERTSCALRNFLFRVMADYLYSQRRA